ncbi:TetR/AcrR family transcriptional regulator [Paenibacillus sp. MBLB4367]|uniref:TetR/AcrR family transcriptional regulator n=1 Tax=Paenibacillus sp. MBLB4367 TaxID=3384767 RepID=UPI00390816B8
MSEKPKRSPGRPAADTSGEPIAGTILNHASQLFMEYGYDGVSISDVAAACGITKASVYYYFPTKADLFVASITEKLGRIIPYIAMVLKREEPLKARIKVMAELYLRNARMDFEGMLMKAVHSITPEQLQTIRSAERKIYETIAIGFDEGNKSGEIRTDDPVMAAHAFTAMLMIGDSRYSEHHGLFESPPDAADRIVDLFWRGIHV